MSEINPFEALAADAAGQSVDEVAEYVNWLHPANDRPVNVFWKSSNGTRGDTVRSNENAIELIHKLSADPSTLTVWCNVHQPHADADGKKFNAGMMEAYQFLSIDVDRNKTVEPLACATDEEREAARKLTLRIMEAFRDDLPAPTQISSGNGHLLLYPISLPYSESAKGLMERLAVAIKAAFDCDGGDIDKAVLQDVARILGVAGTLNANRTIMPNRPARMRTVVEYGPRDPMSEQAFVRWASAYVATYEASLSDSIVDATQEAPASALPKSDPPTPSSIDRRRSAALAYLEKCAPAIEGHGGDLHTFKVAGHLLSFGLSVAEVHSLMDGEWNRRCSPPWESSDLLGKIASASKNGSPRPLKNLNSHAVDDVDVGLAEMRAASKQKHGVVAATEIGISQLFVDRRGSDFVHVDEWRRWLHWDGKRWASASDATVEKAVIDFCRYDLLAYASAVADDTKRADLVKYAGRCQSANAVRNIMSLAASLLSVDAAKLDADPNVINLQDGTLEVGTLSLRPHRRGDMLTKLAGASFGTDANVGALRARAAHDADWDRFLSKVIPDADVRDYLQRAVGYSLTASVAEEKLFLLFGGGRNGKTTFINAVRHVLGDYAHEGDQQLLTYKPSAMKGANSDASANLVGRRFVAVSETADGDRLDEAKVKALVSNKPINAMRKYEKEFVFSPSHKLWIDTNHRPKVRGVDDGIWRRIAIVPFDVQIAIDDVDHQLREKLEAEADMIFRWALEGLRAYREKRLSEPTAIRKAGAEYRNESDTLRLFIAECTGRKSGESVGKAALFAAYRGWLDANGYTFNLTAPAFNARLKELGFSEVRRAAGLFWQDRFVIDAAKDEPSPYDDSRTV